MAWNQSTGEAAKPQPKKPSAWRGVIAGVVCACLAAAVAFFVLSGKDAKPKAKVEKEQGRIKEVTPALSKQSLAEKEKAEHPGMVKVRGKWYPEYDEKGGKIWISKNWVRYHTPVVSTSSCSRVSLEERVFANSADRDIAILINREPGALVVGNYSYGERFVKDFLKSLTRPIIVTKDDDEQTAALKRAVNETKADLKARYDVGEDISKIMSDTREKMKELGAYRAELDKLVRQQIKGADAQSVKDAYEAANKMLADRGVKPLRTPVMLLKHLELKQQRESAAKGKSK